MHSFLQHICIVLVPLIIVNVLHLMVIKKDYFKGLKQPISEKLFGKNKTWRGFVFVSFVNGFVLLILNKLLQLDVLNPFCLGFMLGFAYMLFELPNSFMKRSIGILSGEQAKSNKLLFSLIDKTDSAFGVNLTYFLLGFVTYQYAILLFVCSSLMHIVLSKIVVQLKIKKSF